MREKKLIDDPKEKEVIAIFKAQADALGEKLKDVPAALAADKAAAEKKIADLKAANGPVAEIQAAEKALAAIPKTRKTPRRPGQPPRPRPKAAPSRWRACRGMRRSSRATPTATRRRRRPIDESRRNFLALIFCLMVGTAALPHILMRYYTTPSVKEARESVTWSLFFIFLLYFTAPALAVLVKYEVFTVLVGTPFDKLPAGSPPGAGRPGPAVGAGRQQGRHLPARRDAHRRRHHRAGHARDRGSAVRGLGHGGGRRPGRGAVHRRRPAADHRQRAVARPVLQDDRPERADLAPRGDLQGPAAGRGPGRGLRGGRRSRRTSCSWSRRRSRSRRRRSSRR
jgi:hypothetical protein